MRKSALAAAVVYIGLMAGGSAGAEQWNDPAGRLTFETPPGWQVDPQDNNSASTVVTTFDGSHDCYLFSTPNAGTSTAAPARVRTAGATQLSVDNWTQLANAVNSFFRSGNAQLTSQSVDASGAWPIQRAEFAGAESTVYGIFQARPGFDIAGFCMAYGGGTTVFESLFRSIGHPNDAAWSAVDVPAVPPTP